MSDGPPLEAKWDEITDRMSDPRCIQKLDEITQSLQSVQPLGIAIENLAPRLRRQLAQNHVRSVEIPMRIVAGIEQHVLRIEHVEQLGQMLRIVRLLDRLRSQKAVVADIFARKPPQPWDGRAQRFVVLVEPPQQRRQPADAALDEHDGYFTNTPSQTKLTRWAMNVCDRFVCHSI